MLVGAIVKLFLRQQLILTPIMALLITSEPVGAQQIPGYPPSVDAYDAREVAMLPRFCIYTQLFRDRVPGGKDKAMIDAWYAQMGETFHAMHHYCWGLMKTNRGVLLARDPDTRRFYLADSISEFDYVIQRAPDDFILLPEILTKKGENLVRLGRGPLAVYEFERASSLKPDYWPPYARLSDYYKSTGELDKAREALNLGLAAAPEAAALRRRLAELNQASRADAERRPRH